MKKIICNKTFDKKQITKLIEWFIYNYGAIKTNNIVEKLKFIGFKYATKAGLSLGSNDLNVPKIKKQLIKKTTSLLKKKIKNYKSGNITRNTLLQKEIETWNITNDTLKNEIIKTFRQTNLLNSVYMMTSSGARGNITQIKQLVGMRGLMSNSKGEIISTPIKSSLKEGLKSKEYFISCYGARKGIIDTALKTANSGYLTRKLIYVAQSITIKQQDCGTKNGILVRIFSKNKLNYAKIKGEILGTIICENIINNKGKSILSKGQDICPYIAKKIIENEYCIMVRSVLTCKINSGICQLCYGWNLGQNKLVRLGEAVGTLAAQSIGEPGTQLTMRTFHTGGIFTSKINKAITSPHEGKIIYNHNEGGEKIKNRHGENSFYLKKEKDIYIKKNTVTISKILLPKYSTIYLKPKEKVFKNQMIAEIAEPQKEKRNQIEITEVKSKCSGQIQLKKKNEKLIVIQGNILPYELLLWNRENQKKKYFLYKKGKKNKLEKKNILNINYSKSKSFKNKIKSNKEKNSYEIKEIKHKQRMVFLINNKRKIGINFKNKRIKLGERHKKLNGKVIENKKYFLKIVNISSYIVPMYSKLNIKEGELIEKNKTIFKTQDKKGKTEDIIEGLPKIEKILECKKITTSKNIHGKLEKIFSLYSKTHTNKTANKKTTRKIQEILVKQVQDVYSSQNVDIAEKHIAIIIKQITSKALIRDKGDGNIIEGELIDINRIEKMNKPLKRKIMYQPILIGISKVSLLSNGFISAACFQETVRTLSKSAIKGQIDWLTGLKENIIFGNIIQVGTGKILQ